MQNRYNWTRFICPINKEYSLGPDGFLVDPISAGEYGKIVQPHLQTIEEIEGDKDIPCLVILGEPGIGKTSVLESMYRFRLGNLPSNSIALKWNLNQFSTDDLLVRDIFQSAEILEWKKSKDQNLYLYLDSLDECLLHIDTLKQLLASQIARLDLKRLRLRISCRTGVWPSYLEDELKGSFGLEEILVFTVAPLRRADIVGACEVEKIDEEKFLTEVVKIGASPFAIKPVTLGFLLKTFKENAKLPETQNQIYTLGCKQLCEEYSSSRRGSKNASQLSIEIKFQIACRIAYISIFSNRSSIWLGREQDKEVGDLVPSDFSGDLITPKGSTKITEAMIFETLDTGLFTSRGKNRLGWAHQTYAEFLASTALNELNLSQSQISSLFFYKDETSTKVVPQLTQTSAFLAALNERFNQKLIQYDPEILLSSDCKLLSDEEKKQALQRIFDLVESGDSVLFTKYELVLKLENLKHGDLENFLKGVIANKDLRSRTRHLAIDLAEHCQYTGLSDFLLEVATDVNENYSIRLNAAKAVEQLIPADDVTKLTRLLKNDDLDLDDELKGIALNALWPNHISISEITKLLTPVKKEFFFGSYSHFAQDSFVQNLTDKDLPEALRWAIQHVSIANRDIRFDRTLSHLLVRGVEKIDAPGVLDPYSILIYTMIKTHWPLLRKSDEAPSSQFSFSVPQKIALLDSVLKQVDISELDFRFTYGFGSLVLKNSDIAWLIEKVNIEPNNEIKKIIFMLISGIANWNDWKLSEPILQLAHRDHTASDYFKFLKGPVDLESEEAKSAKEVFYADKKFHESANKNEDWKKRLIPYLEDSIAKLDKGDTGEIINIFRYMSVGLDNGRYDDYLPFADSEVWPLLSHETKSKIIGAAKKHLAETVPEIDSYINENKIVYRVWAGVKSLELLMEVDPNFFTTQNSSFWKKWAPSLFAIRIHLNHESESLIKLHDIAFLEAPSEISETIKRLVMKEANEQGNVFATIKFSSYITSTLRKELLDLVPSQGAKAAISILEELNKFGDPEVDRLTKSFVTNPLPTESDKRKDAARAANILLKNGNDDSWDYIWPIFESDREFAKQTIEIGFREDDFLPKVSETNLTRMFVLLMEEYPPQPRENGPVWIGPSEKAAELRNIIVRGLSERGTKLACDSIAALVQKYPTLEHLPIRLAEGRKRMRWVSWKAPSPSELCLLIGDHQKILVNSHDDLVKLIINSISEYQQQLQGQAQKINNLWNTQKNNFRPKNEDEISDNVKNHLDLLANRGVVVNREVQVKKGLSKGTGQITDIHVNAFTKSSSGQLDYLTVIIEVKGCWHKEVLTAVTTQLAHRYLVESPTKHGIYLVADFLCPSWNQEDSRKQSSEQNNLEKNLPKIKHQADQLRKEGFNISVEILDCKIRTH